MCILLDPHFLDSDKDKHALYQAFLSARNIVKKGAKEANLICIEALPGPLFNYAKTKSNFLSYLCNFSTTYFHPCGTCQMSTASDSLVDEELRVRNVQKLRIADASVIPHIPNVPIAKTIMIVGAVAAAMLTESFDDSSKKKVMEKVK